MRIFKGSMAGHLAITILTTIAFLSVSLGSLGCPATERADVRGIHLSPDAPAVDIWQLGPDLRLFTNLNFTGSTTYRAVDEGTRDFAVTAEGASIAETVLAIGGVELTVNENYTLAVIGTLGDLRAIAFTDDLRTPAEGRVRLRIIHAAQDVGEVDIWNVTDPESPAPIVENVSFGMASDHLTIDAGSYVIGIDVDGDELPDLVFELPELTSRTVLNLYAVQDEEGTPFLLTQGVDGTTVRVDARPATPDLEEEQSGLRLVHLSPDAPPVDIWGPTTPLTTNLVFGEGTEHIAVPAGVSLVEIVPAGQERENAVLRIEDPGLEAGNYYTAVVYGNVEEISALLLVDDLSPTAPGSIRVRPIHVAVGVGAVDLWAARPNQLPVLAFEDLPYGGAANNLEIPAGRWSIGLDVGRDGLIDVTAGLGDVTAATIANVYAVVDGEGGVFFLVQENGRHTRVDAALQDPPASPGEILPLNQ